MEIGTQIVDTMPPHAVIDYYTWGWDSSWDVVWDGCSDDPDYRRAAGAVECRGRALVLRRDVSCDDHQPDRA